MTDAEYEKELAEITESQLNNRLLFTFISMRDSTLLTSYKLFITIHRHHLLIEYGKCFRELYNYTNTVL